MRLLLATCRDLPAGEPGGHLLLEACARHGISARWEVWDDPAVDWSEGLVAVRSTWDYDTRPAAFLDWARSLPAMLNSADVFAWNTDKAYLVALAGAGVPVVPSIVVEGDDALPAAIAEVSPGTGPGAVVKPRVGAGGRGVVVFDGGDPEALSQGALGPGPWLVQPLVDSVRTEGELSLYVLGGAVVSAARKRPAAGDIRVHEQYGGSTLAGHLDAEGADLARRTVVAAQELLGTHLDYARVDAMRLADGTLAVSELEATEPGLYLDVLPGNAEEFVTRVLAPRLPGAD